MAMPIKRALASPLVSYLQFCFAVSGSGEDQTHRVRDTSIVTGMNKLKGEGSKTGLVL